MRITPRLLQSLTDCTRGLVNFFVRITPRLLQSLTDCRRGLVNFFLLIPGKLFIWYHLICEKHHSLVVREILFYCRDDDPDCGIGIQYQYFSHQGFVKLRGKNKIFTLLISSYDECNKRSLNPLIELESGKTGSSLNSV